MSDHLQLAVDNVRKPDPELISWLEELLEKAKTGKIYSFCGVAMCCNGNDYYGHSLARIKNDPSRMYEVLGTLEHLKFRVQQFLYYHTNKDITGQSYDD